MQFLQVSSEPMLSQEPRENLSSRPPASPALHVLCGTVLSTGAEFNLIQIKAELERKLFCFTVVFQKQILFLGNASFCV